MKPRSIYGLLAVASLIVSAGAATSVEVYRNPHAPVEQRVEDALSRLTLDEKIALVSGYRYSAIAPIPRLGLPEVKMEGSSIGITPGHGPSTAYPASVAMAATWDTALARDFGVAMGRDARARGVRVLLGPGVNILYVPQNGRNFEYFSEDPVLNAEMVVPEIEGIQSQGVVATVKHFVCHIESADWYANVHVSERTLREIYLPAFQAAVEKAHVWAVMTAYNRVNGAWCSENAFLINKVLKGEWRFSGVVMSDWIGTHDATAEADAGLDLEMPTAMFYTPQKLKFLISRDQISMATLDDKVRRILRLEIANGYLDQSLGPDPSIPKDDSRSDAVALQIAREGIVLLKNERDLLPLDRRHIKSIVVIGPNSRIDPAGGGSAYVEPLHFISAFDGLRTAAGPEIKVTYVPALADRLPEMLRAATYAAPLKVDFLAAMGSTDVLASRTESEINHHGAEGPPFPGAEAKNYYVRWTGQILPPEDGRYIFAVESGSGVRVYLDGKPVLRTAGYKPVEVSGGIRLRGGKPYHLEVDYFYKYKHGWNIRFAWGKMPPLVADSAMPAIRSADAVVVCAGFDANSEGEGWDRTYALPGDQPALIREIASFNPHTIVVINSGGNVAMADWIDRVPALLQAWYPGQDGGRALAEILFGDTTPSGKLPVTFEKRWEDHSAYTTYPPRTPGQLDLSAGVFVGYRSFDARNIAPRFPFGFGLSYTTFAYSDLRVTSLSGGRFEASVAITNTGKRPGAEVVEFYLAPPRGEVPRPVRELKAFTRLMLAPGETRRATVVFERQAFSYFSENCRQWIVPSGRYLVQVGASSRDLRLSGSISLP